MNYLTISPHYKDSSLIVLVTKDALKLIRQEGQEILDKCGMAFQMSG
jgi:hypothetical protein